MRTLLTAAVLLAFMLASGTAFAHSCPRHIAQIDHQLEEQEVSDEVREKVTSLRDEGEAAHDDGDHDTAMEKLGEAIELLADEAHGMDAY